jgi:hypothetical protein
VFGVGASGSASDTRKTDETGEEGTMISKYLITLLLGVIAYGASKKINQPANEVVVPPPPASPPMTKVQKKSQAAEPEEPSQWEIWSEAVDLDLKVRLARMDIEQLQEQLRILDAYELKLIGESSLIGEAYNMVLIERISNEIKERRIKAKSRLERLRLKIRQAKGLTWQHSMELIENSKYSKNNEMETKIIESLSSATRQLLARMDIVLDIQLSGLDIEQMDCPKEDKEILLQSVKSLPNVRSSEEQIPLAGVVEEEVDLEAEGQSKQPKEK